MPDIIFMFYYVKNFIARTAEQSETISGVGVMEILCLQRERGEYVELH